MNVDSTGFPKIDSAMAVLRYSQQALELERQGLLDTANRVLLDHGIPAGTIFTYKPGYGGPARRVRVDGCVLRRGNDLAVRCVPLAKTGRDNCFRLPDFLAVSAVIQMASEARNE